MPITQITVDEFAQDQRIDNFLFTHLKGVPKSRLYRALRSGELRVNKKRVTASYRLQQGDVLRVPPLRVAAVEEPPKLSLTNESLLKRLVEAVIYEDSSLLIINKPAGLAVHGGSGIRFGVIEGLRHLRPKLKFLELVHRLDRDTTGCLLLAKKPSVLKELQRALAQRQFDKQYLALLSGQWRGGVQHVKQPLLKSVLSSGERLVKTHPAGKVSETIFEPLQVFSQATLVLAKPLTGRTHQIRVHAAFCGHPILGDDKYGDKQANKALGIKQLLLHAACLQFDLPGSGEPFGLCACLSDYFLKVQKSGKL